MKKDTALWGFILSLVLAVAYGSYQYGKLESQVSTLIHIVNDKSGMIKDTNRAIRNIESENAVLGEKISNIESSLKDIRNRI